MIVEMDGIKEKLNLEMNRANQAEKHAHIMVNIIIQFYCYLIIELKYNIND